MRYGFACVDHVAEMMSCGQWDINQPDPPASFVALKIGVVYSVISTCIRTELDWPTVIEESKDSCDDCRNPLSVCASSGFQIYTKGLLCRELEVFQ